MRLGISLSLTQQFGGFSPASLFALAEPGVWYDPSDVANLDWRRNLLTYTEQFDNAAWVKTNATVTANVDGVSDKLIPASAASDGRVTQSYTGVSGSTYTLSVEGKAAEFSNIRLYSDDGGTNVVSVSYNLTTGAITTALATVGSWSGASTTKTDLSDGYLRLTMTWTATSSAPTRLSIWCRETGNAASGILIRNAQLELGTTATEYQRITDVNTEVRERFPTATLFQDAAGTTPVTAAGQPVGLVLDKSQGLALGPELVTNGDFSAGSTGWTLEAGWSVSGGTASRTNSASTSAISQTASIVAGRFYQVSFDLVSIAGGAIRVNLGSTSQLAEFATAGPKTCIVQAQASNSVFYLRGSSTFEGSIDNISVRELAGNHATQSTAASRPTYGVVPATGRRNLLLWSENPTQAPWATIYSSVTVASPVLGYPMFTLTTAADVPTSNYLGRVQQTLSLNTGLHTWTNIQAANADGLIVLVVAPSSPATVGGSGGSKPVVFNTATQQFTEQGLGTGGVYGAESLGSGLWRITLTFNVTAAGTVFFQRTVDRTSTAGVSGGRSIIIGPSQLETGSTATAYQRVTNAFDVTEAGVQSLSYLSFDGIDDFLVTPTITPNIDKVQVFAGVRKLSDAAAGMIVEHSAALTANNGTFYLIGPSSGGLANYAFVSKGTSSAGPTASGFAAPISNVVTNLGDISGDRATMRVNGTQVAQSTVDQGTGNYLAYPLFIGRRAGTSLPFNGQLYSLITRFGANLTAQQISNTETWVNGKTGAY